MSPLLLRTLARTFLERSLPLLGLTIAFFVLGPLGIRELLRLDGLVIERGALDPLTFQIPLVCGAGLCLISAAVQGHHGLRQHAYVMPISTTALATWQMAATAVFVMGGNVLVLLLLRSVFDVEWPLLGPTLFLATLSIVIHAAAWQLLDFRFWRLVAAVAVVLGGVLWVQTRFHSGALRGPVVPWHATALDVLSMGMVAGIAVWLGRAALGRDRHARSADGRTLERVARDTDEGLLAYSTRRATAFESPARAAAWLIWARTRVVAMAVSLSFCGLFLVLVGRVLHGEPVELEAVIVMSLLLVSLSGFVSAGGLVAALDRNGDGRMTVHVAAMPVSDRELGRQARRVAQRTTLLVTAIVLLFAAIPVCLSLIEFGPGASLRGTPSSELVQRFGWWLLPLHLLACLAACWTALGGFGTLALLGRPKLTGGVVGALLGLGVVTLVVVRFVLPTEVRATAGVVALTLVAVACVATTVTAHVAAWIRGLVRWGDVVLAAVLWSVVAGLACVVGRDVQAAAFGVGVSSLAALPIPGIPVAVAWNRHR